MMTLGVLIGNTNIKIGYVLDGVLVSRSYKNDSYDFSDIKHLPINNILLASVVPNLIVPVNKFLTMLFGIQATIMVKEDIALNLQRYDTRNIGIDRVLSCYGGCDVSGAFVVFDLGTAISVSVVNGARFFCGGAILPGVEMGLNALGNGTALLPSLDISLVTDSVVIGDNTQSCLVSGAIHGTASMIEGMAQRIEAELGEPLQVIVTGGFAPYVVAQVQRPIIYRPHLTMEGLLQLA